MQYTDPKLASMIAIAKAHQQSSLRAFKDVIEQYKEELEHDPVIHRHLQQLYQNLLEKNLLRIVAPFSEVEISHIASLIEMDVATVERKCVNSMCLLTFRLSQMILDKKLHGILDQGNDCLIVFEHQESDVCSVSDTSDHQGVFPAALEVMTHLGSVVDSLYNRASSLR